MTRKSVTIRAAWITAFAIILGAVIGGIFYIFSKTSTQNAIEGDYVTGSKSMEVYVQGDYISGDKESYITYVNYYKNEDRAGDIVSDAAILTFFYKYSSVFNQTISEIPEQTKVDLPDFLKVPYNMNVVISECHGLGFEYTMPSKNTEITLVHTTAPIENHFFTKYTNEGDFPKSVQFIKVTKKDILWSGGRFVGSNQVFWVFENADLQLIDTEIKYSGEDDNPKNIDYLWIFGSNSTGYWNQLDPEELAQKNAVRLIKTYIMKKAAENSYDLYKRGENKGED
jgi:hypothetical protein